MAAKNSTNYALKTANIRLKKSVKKYVLLLSGAKTKKSLTETVTKA